jgi:SAM-dependent methyltransferase
MQPSVVAHGRSQVWLGQIADFGAEPRLRYKARSYELVPASARSVLDVGFGTGDDVLALAERLHPDAAVVGLEPRLSLVDEATRRARNVALNVRFAVGDAHSLPFADDVFDVVRADCVLQSLDDPARAVREMVRVTRPHGSVLVHDREEIVLGEGVIGAGDAARALERNDAFSLFERAGLICVHFCGCFELSANGKREQGVSVCGVKPHRAEAVDGRS